MPEHLESEPEARQDKKKVRFRIQTLLIATAVIAGIAYAVMLNVAWARQSKTILQQYNRVRGADGPTIDEGEFRGRRYAIPCRIDSGEVQRDPATEEDNLRRRSGEIWVSPPGEWVTQPSRAIYLLVNHL